jgi:hypothetical protein
LQRKQTKTFRLFPISLGGNWHFWPSKQDLWRKDRDRVQSLMI